MINIGARALYRDRGPTGPPLFVDGRTALTLLANFGRTRASILIIRHRRVADLARNAGVEAAEL
jgi:hypothetical protein